MFSPHPSSISRAGSCRSDATNDENRSNGNMLTIRAATADDAAGIARVYMESAEYHARLEPDRYWLPSLDAITAQYRERGRLSQTNGDAITLVAELDAQVVGFVDAKLD